MIITLNGTQYETEEMTEEQQSIISSIQSIDSVLQMWANEVAVRQMSIAAINVQRAVRVEEITKSLGPPDKKGKKPKTKAKA